MLVCGVRAFSCLFISLVFVLSSFILHNPDSVPENPPSGKQMVSKMLVIKKVSKEDTSTAFSAGFATAGALPTNGNKAPITGSSVYKNLVPKPAVAPVKVRGFRFVFF